MRTTRKTQARSLAGRKKLLLAIVASALSVALALGGAFAWYDIAQHRVNKFRGTAEAEVTLHDEFDGVNKHVFVENSGTSTIYVRVRLDEYMQVGSTIFTMDTTKGWKVPDIRNRSTWIPHTFGDPTKIGDCGHTDTPGAGRFHDFYQWSMTGSSYEEGNFRAGTPGMVYDRLLPGTELVETMPDADGKMRLRGDLSAADAAIMGNVAYGTMAPAQAPILLSSLSAVTPAGYATQLGRINAHLASPEPRDPFDNTEPRDGTGMTDLAFYNVFVQGCWLLDDTAPPEAGGGWAYWSLPLKGIEYNADGTINRYGQATNLLLERVDLIQEPQDDWTYRIDVKLQAVTSNDFARWDDASTLAPANPMITWATVMSPKAKDLQGWWGYPPVVPVP